jgi:toxin ParE1/3/4
MTRRIIRRPRACIDLIDLSDYIGRDSLPAAERFLAAIETTLTFLVRHPDYGVPVGLSNNRLSGIRACRIDGFPNHLIFYLANDEHIEVVRLLHGSQDWLSVLGRD